MSTKPDTQNEVLRPGLIRIGDLRIVATKIAAWDARKIFAGDMGLQGVIVWLDNGTMLELRGISVEEFDSLVKEASRF